MDDVVGLSVRALGPVQVLHGNREYELSSRRQRALLAALATSAGRWVSVSGLVDAVWDEDPPERARTTLQTYVSRLRRQLGVGAIEHGPAGYRLSPDAWTDVGSARQIAVVLESMARTDFDRRADLALEALELWSGPVLAEFADHDWFRGVIVELEALRANLVDVAAEALIETGRAAQALGLVQAALSDDPLREPTQVLLIRALHAAGRSLDAIRAADRYRRRLREETGLDPRSAFRETEHNVLSGEDPSAPAPAQRGFTSWSSASLPRPTPIIGREAAIRELDELLAAGRVVTITGVGGVGKTRLAAEIMNRRSDDQCWVAVDLAPVSQGAVAATIGAALGYRAERADERTVAELLRSESVVLVLDNCEHVVAEVCNVIRSVTDSCPDVRVLATSRVRLELPDEQVCALQPLPVGGRESPAVELFVDRLRRAHRRVDIAADDPSIEVLCARLDGVPLALELAASRAAALGVHTLTERLEATTHDLVARHGTDARHATMGNVVAWSVDLLGPQARSLLSALSVFHGEFGIDAAEAVGAAVVEESVPVLLGRLVDTSLVSASSDRRRYRLLELIRRFTSEALDQAEQAGAVRQAHARWVAACVAEIDRSSAGSEERETVTRLDGLRHEVLAALQWCVASDDLDTATQIVGAIAGPLLYRPDPDMIRAVRWVSATPSSRGAAHEAALLAAGARAAFLLGELPVVQELAERSMAHPAADTSSRHRALHALGVVQLYQGRFQESRARFQQIVADDTAAIVDRLDALAGQALAACYLGDPDDAETLASQHRALATAIGSDTYLAFTDYVDAEIHVARDDTARAVEALTRSTERAWDTGAAFVWGIASTVLAALLVRHRPPIEARQHLPVLLERWRRTATWPQLWTTLRLTAEFLADNAQPEVALLILEAAQHDPAAPSLVGADLASYQSLRSTLEARLGEAAVAGVTAGARAIDRAVILDRAIDALSAVSVA